VARRINVALVVFLLFYLVIGLLQPNYLEPAGAMNFLHRAALPGDSRGGAALRADQWRLRPFRRFVGDADRRRRVNADRERSRQHMVGGRCSLRHWSLRRSHQWRGGRLSPHAIDHRHARTLLSVNGVSMMWSGGAPRGYLPDNFRMFGRFVFHDVPVVKIFPVAILVLAILCACAMGTAWDGVRAPCLRHRG
jgi:ribose transport system permease protein